MASWIGQLLFSGTSVFLSKNNCLDYPRIVLIICTRTRTDSRPYARKNRMTNKTKNSWLVESDNFRFQVRPFFFRVRRPPKGRPVKKRVFAFSRNLLKESFAEKKKSFYKLDETGNFRFQVRPRFCRVRLYPPFLGFQGKNCVRTKKDVKDEYNAIKDVE